MKWIIEKACYPNPNPSASSRACIYVLDLTCTQYRRIQWFHIDITYAPNWWRRQRRLALLEDFIPYIWSSRSKKVRPPKPPCRTIRCSRRSCYTLLSIPEFVRTTSESGHFTSSAVATRVSLFYSGRPFTIARQPKSYALSDVQGEGKRNDHSFDPDGQYGGRTQDLGVISTTL
jgi:hypothetical protein